MKKHIITALITLTIIFVANQLLAQGPPDPPGDPGSGGGPVGGGASLEGGIGFLIGLASAWGGRKLYLLSKKKEETVE
ncbi:MAG TPA: hypothetical protein PKE03_10065 [Bacteroidales bacterium]|nr:hypothetical protein [Bacteroidales bacterium]